MQNNLQTTIQAVRGLVWQEWGDFWSFCIPTNHGKLLFVTFFTHTLRVFFSPNRGYLLADSREVCWWLASGWGARRSPHHPPPRGGGPLPGGEDSLQGTCYARQGSRGYLNACRQSLLGPERLWHVKKKKHGVFQKVPPCAATRKTLLSSHMASRVEMALRKQSNVLNDDALYVSWPQQLRSPIPFAQFQVKRELGRSTRV